MIFDQAIELARLIEARPGWHMLEVGVKSGTHLDSGLFSVQAVCDLYWQYMHYFGQPGDLEAWPRYAESFEVGARRRASSHEVGR